MGSTLLAVVVLAVLLFALVAVVLTARISDRLSRALVFKPSRRDLGSPADLRLPFEDLEIPCAGGGKVHGWWIPRKAGAGEDAPVILFLHGRRGNLGAQLPMLRFLHSLGADLLAFDYPGYGRSPGEPSEAGCLAAAEAAWNLLRARRPDSRVVLYGRSLGCALAAFLASREPCAGLVFHGGFTSVPDLAADLHPRLPVRPFCRVRLDALGWIAGCRSPLLVLHGRQDRFIPIAHALRVYERAPVPKRFVPLAGGHDAEGWMLSPEVRKALAEMLAGRAGSWPTGDPV
ncbi:MAG: alpha/beta fold hydrolase [Acidobacteriota bacterium]